MAEAKPKLPDEVRDRIRFKHYSIRTEECYVDWVAALSCSTIAGPTEPVLLIGSE